MVGFGQRRITVVGTLKQLFKAVFQYFCYRSILDNRTDCETGDMERQLA